MKKKVSIIGSGFSSLAAACYLSKFGFEVHVFEKNSMVVGRAARLKIKGFTFDIGPTWYWMPDIFENFFSDFSKSPQDYYSLERLDPSYEVYFGKKDSIKLEDSFEKRCDQFEAIEKGSKKKLETFISEAKTNYKIAIGEVVYKMYGNSFFELITINTIKKIKYFFTSIKRQVVKNFKNPNLTQILQFPVLFLGAKPSATPAFYNFMSYADFGLGTWHPKNGMYSVVLGIEKLAKELGVKFHLNSEVQKILTKGNKASGVRVNEKDFFSDIVLSGADYVHSESLLDFKDRVYSEKYWKKKVFAPSALLFFIGFNKKIKNVSHHTLFFDADFDKHARSIYDDPSWPIDPLIYTNFPSITDKSMAPKNKEACTVLVPIAAGIEDTKELRKSYFELIIGRIEKLTEQSLKNDILFHESYCINDFVNDYNSYKGNAYGLANTLMQTAFLRPKLKSKKIKKLYFSGQLTVPGPGVPPALISGKLSADLIRKEVNL